mmetsp:Transcript_943/g.3558  ORF Transcript_943/g.3558 Transcript_943/m.3558 type:complete len:203 (+) Transcript_943:648-1256(+)
MARSDTHELDHGVFLVRDDLFLDLDVDAGHDVARLVRPSQLRLAGGDGRDDGRRREARREEGEVGVAAALLREGVFGVAKGGGDGGALDGGGRHEPLRHRARHILRHELAAESAPKLLDGPKALFDACRRGKLLHRIERQSIVLRGALGRLVCGVSLCGGRGVHLLLDEPRRHRGARAALVARAGGGEHVHRHRHRCDRRQG